MAYISGVLQLFYECFLPLWHTVRFSFENSTVHVQYFKSQVTGRRVAPATNWLLIAIANVLTMYLVTPRGSLLHCKIECVGDMSTEKQP